MAKKTYALPNAGNNGWNSGINNNFTQLGADPIPLANFTNVAGLPAFGANDDGIAIVDSGENSAVKIVYVADGATWKILNQVAFIADAAGWADATAQADFNALLAAMRGRVMKPTA